MTKKKTTTKTKEKQKHPKTTRVKLTTPLPGMIGKCINCDELISGAFLRRNHKPKYYVLVNVYHRFRWVRTESWHLSCYEDTGMPYGPTGDYQPPLSISGPYQKRRSG